MTTYEIKETDGTNWGVWTAASEDEAVEMLMTDVQNNPDCYGGEPTLNQLVVSEF